MQRSTSHVNNWSEMSKYRYNPEPQVIESKYINPRALIELLRDVYGTSEKGQNNFLVEV